jgi:hypothetical protein
MRGFFRDNSLSIVTAGLFAACLVGQAVFGHSAYNDEASEHGAPTLGLVNYLATGHFIEAVFENWESEFLQMAVFVVLTRFLRQKGSSESKSLEGPDDVDADPRTARSKRDAPWPVRQGGIALVLYEHSLSSALLLLFSASFALHAYGGMRAHNQEALWHGSQVLSFWGFLATAEFWQQSFQNWQSEFLSVAVLVLFSIVLRERGSSQSKAVADPIWKTGE